MAGYIEQDVPERSTRIFGGGGQQQKVPGL